MTAFTFLRLLYHEDNNVNHEAASNKNKKFKSRY